MAYKAMLRRVGKNFLGVVFKLFEKKIEENEWGMICMTDTLRLIPGLGPSLPSQKQCNVFTQILINKLKSITKPF